MRLPTLLLLSGLALGAAACATPAAKPGPELASSGSPQPVDGYDWFLNQDGDEARLAYGLAESDDLKIGLDCRRGSGRLALSAPGRDGEKQIYLESGGETARFSAASEPSQLHEGVFLTAEAEAGAPVFQRFRRLGWLAMWRGEERQTYAPHRESAAGIEQFFAFCG